MVDYKKIALSGIRGVGTKLAIAKRKHLEENLGLKTMFATVEPNNIKSINILKRINFDKINKHTIEGKEGFFRDLYVYHSNNEEKTC
ncbi:MAG: GNAT family N-acetyltransferase [Candidatus Nomurabacteria bacterium]|jgi:RimJ/RimL family protein N-acetyltransferase|nr:GNAT family N-acetyltransferase [Candidatus Nomurabacteria bacterium]